MGAGGCGGAGKEREKASAKSRSVRCAQDDNQKSKGRGYSTNVRDDYSMMATAYVSAARLQRGDDGFGEGFGAYCAAYVAGGGFAFGVDLFYGGLDLVGGFGFVDVVKHEDG